MNSNSNQNIEQYQDEVENDLKEEELNNMEIQNKSNNSIEKDSNNDINMNNKNNIEIYGQNNEPIYVMTLALNQGQTEKIEIFANSEPTELAYNFCRKNNLDFNALEYLKEQITNLIEDFSKNVNGIEEDDNNLNEEDIKEGDINIPDIEESQEDQEINSNNKLKGNNSIITKNNINDEVHQIKDISPKKLINGDLLGENNRNKIEDENYHENHKDDNNKLKNDKGKKNELNKNIELFPDTNNMNNNEKINNGNDNDLENELFLIENNNDKEADDNNNDNNFYNESDKSNNTSKEVNEKDNYYDVNKTKKKYKINEDIIIGVGAETEKENYLYENNNIDNYINNNNILPEQRKTNNYNILNEENDNNVYYFKNEQFFVQDNNCKQESLLEKTNKILNESIKNNSNSNTYIDSNKIKNNIIIPQNAIKNNDLLINNYLNNENTNNSNQKNNIIIPKTTNNIERKTPKYSNKNKDLISNKINNNYYNDIINKNINEKAKNNTCKISIAYNNKRIKKIKDNENFVYSDIIGKNTKKIINNLSDRNKLLQEEKNKELLSIQKEINKYNSKMDLKNKNINNDYESLKYNNNIKNIFLKNKNNNQNQIHTNYYNKNISLRKLNKLKEEYDKKYSFQPVINDNYKTDLTFEQRLNIFNNISKQKKEELKNNLTNLKLDENGQELFKPKLISKQYFLHTLKKNNHRKIEEIENNEKIDVFNKNYLYYKKYNSNKEKLKKKIYYNRNIPHIFSKTQSDKLLIEANHKAFSNLFSELDSDQDNLITSLNINLNNIPNNILKIIEPLLMELKDDNQTLTHDEFIKAMTKLFETISSTERREIIKEYTNKKKNIDKNISEIINNSKINYNNTLTKNNSLKKNDFNNSISNINISNINNNNSIINSSSISRIFTHNYASTDINSFDNNYLSCRPKTPIYNKMSNNNNYNFFNNINKKLNLKTIVKNNTNKLAEKHFMRIQKMMNDYSNKFKSSEKINDKDNDYFDKRGNRQENLNNSILNSNNNNKNSYRSLLLNKNTKFNSIHDCTFNNYLKNLN